MNMEEKAADCGLVIITQSDNVFDLMDMLGGLVLESVSRGEVAKAVALAAKDNPTVQAKIGAVNLPLPEVDVDPDPFGEE